MEAAIGSLFVVVFTSCGCPRRSLIVGVALRRSRERTRGLSQASVLSAVASDAIATTRTHPPCALWSAGTECSRLSCR